MTVTFCGHGDTRDTSELRRWLKQTIEALILQGADRFYLGGYGSFDSIAAAVLRDLKPQYPYIDIVLVLAYLGRDPGTDLYDRTMYPPLEGVPKRFAIFRRNQWMAEVSEVVVANVDHDWGGAAQMLDYAARHGKRILNYAE